LTQLGVSSLELCYGYSMGGMQALHLAATFPSFVKRVVAACATASCHAYNAVFLEALEATLAPVAGRPSSCAERSAALEAFGRIYAGWALPPEWYRGELWRTHGYTSLDDFLRRTYGAWMAGADLDDLLCQLRTWRSSRLSSEQLARVTASVVYLPSPGDRYFPPADVAPEASMLRRCRVIPLSHEWNHWAGDPHRPGQGADSETIRSTVHALLKED
jgi:homoserine O-acetyltransferase